MPGDTDFNISDELEEGGDETDTTTHAGEGEGEGDGGEAEDRGDTVAEGTGEEGDPDAAAAGGEGEGEGDPTDPEFLQSLAGEGGGKPKVVPYARLAEVTAQNAKLMELLDGFASGRLSAGKADAAAAAAAADTTPAFDMKAKVKERNSALLEGDEDKAAEIDMQIEEYRNTTIRQAARQEAMADFSAAQQKQALDTIVTQAFSKYTFLNDQSEDFSEEALDEVMMYRNHYLTKGDNLPTALAKAIEKVCPQYVEGDGDGDGDGGDGKAAPAAAAGGRDPTKIVRNAKAARAQPPETARAGTANRSTIDVSKLDIEHMDDDKFDALPEAVKAQIRGDAVA